MTGLRIVDVSGSYSRHGGGIRTYVGHKLAAANSAGHRLVIVAPGRRDGVERVSGGRIVWVASPRSPVDRRYGVFVRPRRIHAVLDAERPDVVEASSPFASAHAVSTWAGRAVTSLVFHTDPVAVWADTLLGRLAGFDRVDRLCAPYWRRLGRLCGHFDVTVTSGAWLANRLRAHGVPRAEAVPFGIDKARFGRRHRDPNLRTALLAACGLPPEASLLLSVGRMDPEKRIGVLLDAHRRLFDSRRVGLVLCGRGSLERWYRWRARAADGVHVLGYEPDPDRVAAVMASADALVHASGAETYGLVVAEAACSGLPVVVPDRGGAAQFARFGQAYATGDAGACAAAIERVLDDPCREFPTASIDSHSQHFNNLFELYGRLARRGPEQQRAA